MRELDVEIDNPRTDSYAAEQLAELQLLTRADHHDGIERAVPYSRRGLALSIDERPSDGDGDGDDDGDDEKEDGSEAISIESTGSSSFTALLAASRRLAGTSSSSSSRAASASTFPPTLTLADSPRHAQASSSDARTRRPTTMPTLCEEQDAEEEEEEEEEHEEEEEEGDKITDPGPESAASAFKDGDDRENQRRRVRGAQTINLGSSDEMNPHARDARDEDIDEAAADPVFTEMLHQLPYDLSFLALSVADLTVRNLERVRNALARSESPGGGKLLPYEELHDANPPLEKMRLVRTMLAVDTLRLFLLRCDEDDVLLAVTDAVRSIYAQYVHDHGACPLSRAQGILTSSNITRVVLLVRDALEKQPQQQSRSGSNNDCTQTSSTSPFSFLRSGRPSPAKSCASSVSFSPSSWMSRRSSSSLALSPGKAQSPRHAASLASSPGRTVSESSPRRACSILASEGTHVLMNEKIVAFQHRGDVNRLPSFKVRRDSAGNVEEAARRRQRSIQYGNEATRALRG